jgi:hypothetical protein
MRFAAAIVAVVVLGTAAAGCGGKTSAVVRTVTVRAQPAAESPNQRFFGRIRSLVRVGGRYELRFDPAWFLSGVTANVAAAQDTGTRCRPISCPPVPNDNYRLEEGHRVLTFIVPVGARGTVLVKKSANSGPFPATTITAGQLAQIVAGKSALKLFEPLSSGVWLLVHVDTVRAFAQQYQP